LQGTGLDEHLVPHLSTTWAASELPEHWPPSRSPAATARSAAVRGRITILAYLDALWPAELAEAGTGHQPRTV